MNHLFEIAENENIEVLFANIPNCESMSMDGYICIDYSLLWGGADERVHFAHELGHCMTGSFYNRYSKYDVRAQHENRANKWAIKKLVPEDELNKAVKNGITEVWELAEYFSVTEPFIFKAIQFYKENS